MLMREQNILQTTESIPGIINLIPHVEAKNGSEELLTLELMAECDEH